ncbi:MAG TPA: hypothetical protein VNP97_06360 [Microbacterium sp.]|nr:hypothetical protein [Microbacterium sp.]
MSDDIDIRGGGAVAVDTATLRHAADGFASLAAELSEIAGVVRAAGSDLRTAPRSVAELAYAVDTVRFAVDAAIDDAHALTGALRAAAAVYDVVEARAERAAAEAAGDLELVALIDARLAALRLANPEAEGQATLDMFGHWLRWPGELAGQASGALWWLMPGFHSLAFPIAWALQRMVGSVRAGTVPATSRLPGRAGDVVVQPIAARQPATAPTSLAGIARRMPGGGAARVRVERYTMRDGTRQFAVYIAGMQTMAPQTREPFDMSSNVELYTGDRSASFDATLSALEQAGAEPGDVVHAIGHSQGAMIAAHVALEGGFDTRTLVSFGSPVEADLGAGTLSVNIRHTDDPVTALAGGGHAQAVGAPGSFVAERAADPLPGPQDLRMPVHGMDAYTETARLIDASGDARVGAMRRLFDELGAAASVDVTEYSATRILPMPAPAPQPAPEPRVSPSASGGG